MLNIEKYKDEIKNYIENGDDLQDGLSNIYDDVNHHVANCQEVLDWLCEEYKEPILDDAEKAYLSAVIKPFRNRTISIKKVSNSSILKEHIRIRLKYDYISLPYFREGKMYKNMVVNREYTLEELGL